MLSNQQIVTFSLSKRIYAAKYEQSIIILDAVSDRYISLIEESAVFFEHILTKPFGMTNQKYVPCDNEQSSETCTYWIDYFLHKQFIQQSNSLSHLQTPLQSGGLIEYRWNTKQVWTPFKNASLSDITYALYMLWKVHHAMKKYGMRGLLDLIECYMQKKVTMPSQEEIQKLADAVDAATKIFPRRTLCLVWATTFVLCGLQKKWHVQLVVGVQTNPFYAHAWVETKDAYVVHDDPAIAKKLAIVLREPFFERPAICHQ